MSLTGIARNIFKSRMHELERHQNEGEQMQRKVMARLIDRAKQTEFG